MENKIKALIRKERKRQEETLQLIPSENYTSKAVREAVGSVLMHKYSEGQTGKRYYEGNKNIDEIELICKERAKEVFQLPKDWKVNVQAISGSIANLAVFNALLEPGDKIMSMYLPDGGHISHGWTWPENGLRNELNEIVYKESKTKVSIISKLFEIVQYKVSKVDNLIDYNELSNLAEDIKPKIIVSGGTAYPREIDHKKLSQIAQAVGAYYLADIAHEAGLVAGRVNKTPVGIADVVTMTTHKTLRGPRGAVILSKKELSERIDRSVFPGIQGGPFDNNIAGIAVCLEEALENEFTDYAKQVIKNAKKLSSELINRNYNVVTNGTDKHHIIIDLRNKDLTVGPAGRNMPGKYISRALNASGIIVNKNSVPFEEGDPNNPSGIRLGTPFITTRGMKEKEMELISEWFDRVIELAKQYLKLEFEKFTITVSKDEGINDIKKQIKQLCSRFPLLE